MLADVDTESTGRPVPPLAPGKPSRAGVHDHCPYMLRRESWKLSLLKNMPPNIRTRFI